MAPPTQSIAVRTLTVPARAQSVFPALSTGNQSLWMSWIDEADSGLTRLRVAAYQGSTWGEPEVVAEGNNWFVNWADYPAVLVQPNGSLWTHHLKKNGQGVYAYDVMLRHKTPEGSWSPVFRPYTDSSEAEHGFASLIDLGQEQLGVIWLDGRNYVGPNPSEETMLGFSLISAEGQISETQFLDQRVCDCCQTDLAATPNGLVAVYRNRSEEEVRDIYYTRQENGQWTEPQPVFADHWKIGGCPVNGPAIASQGEAVMVVWYTMAGEVPKVQASYSPDGGKSFQPPVRIDRGQTLGRVAVVWAEDQAWISWIESTEGKATICLRSWDGQNDPGPVQEIAPIDEARASGFPELAWFQSKLYLAWTETKPHNQVALREIVLP